MINLTTQVLPTRKFNMRTLNFILLISLTQLADAGPREIIRFAPGTSKATIQGGVVRGDENIYTLRAKPGQFMRVKINSLENNAVFQIYSEVDGIWEELPQAGVGDEATSWNGNLPKGSGRYKIAIGTTRGNASYSLMVQIK